MKHRRRTKKKDEEEGRKGGRKGNDTALEELLALLAEVLRAQSEHAASEARQMIELVDAVSALALRHNFVPSQARESRRLGTAW